MPVMRSTPKYFPCFISLLLIQTVVTPKELMPALMRPIFLSGRIDTAKS